MLRRNRRGGERERESFIINVFKVLGDAAPPVSCGSKLPPCWTDNVFRKKC